MKLLLDENSGSELLDHAGKISHENAKIKAENEPPEDEVPWL